jgi:hypothetical protein
MPVAQKRLELECILRSRLPSAKKLLAGGTPPAGAAKPQYRSVKCLSVTFGGTPRSGWKKPVSDRRLSDLVSVGLLTRVFPADVVDQVIADAGRTERRHLTALSEFPRSCLGF